MGTAVMASHTGYGGDGSAFVVLVEAEIFLVDLCRHFEHMAGNIFFGFCIAAKIQVTGSAICRRCMAKVTFHAQCGFPVVHDLIEVVVADVFGKDLEISLWLILLRTCGGHSYYHQGGQRQCNNEFFTVQHKKLIFEPLVWFKVRI
jgi:hypothetical protein